MFSYCVYETVERRRRSSQNELCSTNDCPSISQKLVDIVNRLNSLINLRFLSIVTFSLAPGRVAQSVGHLTRKSGVLGSIPDLATYFRFSFRFFKKGSCQLLAKVCARSTG